MVNIIIGCDVVDDLGVDWDELYQEFMATNATMDYAESNFFDDPELTDTVSNLRIQVETEARIDPRVWDKTSSSVQSLCWGRRRNATSLL